MIAPPNLPQGEECLDSDEEEQGDERGIFKMK